MNIMTKKIAAFTFAALTALGFASCNERKFHVEGAIAVSYTHLTLPTSDLV